MGVRAGHLAPGPMERVSGCGRLPPGRACLGPEGGGCQRPAKELDLCCGHICVSVTQNLDSLPSFCKCYGSDWPFK